MLNLLECFEVFNKFSGGAPGEVPSVEYPVEYADSGDDKLFAEYLECPVFETSEVPG